MNIDIARLKALAEAAIDGPWTVRRESNIDGDERFVVLDANGFWVADCGQAPKDAAFIAAAREGVLALCERIEALEANAVRMREYRFACEGIETDGNGNPKESTRDCTCLGSCRGADTLAPGWRCALARRER